MGLASFRKAWDEGTSTREPPMTNQIICYHKRHHIILGIGTNDDGAITNSRYNAGDCDIDTSEWATIPASDKLIEAISCKGGDLDWCIKDGVGQV
jgi:hypothetical protein